MAPLQVVCTWRLSGGLHLMNRFFYKSISPWTNIPSHKNITADSSLAGNGWRRKYSGYMCQVLVEALRMPWEHMSDSCLSLLVIHSSIRDVSVLIAVTIGQVLFTNTVLGVRALKEKCPALCFLMQLEGVVEKIQAILLFK